jgi:hypothetical protein
MLIEEVDLDVLYRRALSVEPEDLVRKVDHFLASKVVNCLSRCASSSGQMFRTELLVEAKLAASRFQRPCMEWFEVVGFVLVLTITSPLLRPRRR